MHIGLWNSRELKDVKMDGRRKTVFGEWNDDGVGEGDDDEEGTRISPLFTYALLVGTATSTPHNTRRRCAYTYFFQLHAIRMASEGLVYFNECREKRFNVATLQTFTGSSSDRSMQGWTQVQIQAHDTLAISRRRSRHPVNLGRPERLFTMRKRKKREKRKIDQESACS